ncbi:MAG: DUF5011 domain-containing protein [Parcubacteria group bacterium]|nr:DUF5011 domain-containing protein [Parcubacteria group bacterium]
MVSMGDELLFDGKKYMSARRLAEGSKYSSDHLSRLARAKKIDGRLIGRNWFIHPESIEIYQQQLNGNHLFKPAEKSFENGQSRQDSTKVTGHSLQVVDDNGSTPREGGDYSGVKQDNEKTPESLPPTPSHSGERHVELPQPITYDLKSATSSGDTWDELLLGAVEQNPLQQSEQLADSKEDAVRTISAHVPKETKVITPQEKIAAIKRTPLFEKVAGTGTQLIRYVSNLPAQAWQAGMPVIELSKLASGAFTAFLLIAVLGTGLYVLNNTPYRALVSSLSLGNPPIIEMVSDTAKMAFRDAKNLLSGVGQSTIKPVGTSGMEIARNPHGFFSGAWKTLTQTAKGMQVAALRIGEVVADYYSLISMKLSNTASMGAALIDVPQNIARGLYDAVTSLFTSEYDLVTVPQEEEGEPIRITEEDLEEARKKLLGEEPGPVQNGDSTIQLQSEITRLQNEVNQLKRSGITIESPIQPKLVERIVERVIPGLTQTSLDDQLNVLKNELRKDIFAVQSAAAQQTSTLSHTVALSNRIDQLNDVTLTNVTVATLSGITDADIPNTITASNYLLLAGGTVTGNVTVEGTSTLIGALSLSSFSATSTSNPSTVDYRLGIGTSSPYAALAVVGETVSTYFTATSTTATSTFSGQTIFNSVPGAPHTFALGSWATGVAGAQPLSASLIVNPASAGSDTNLISASVNGAVRFLVDGEGDLFANSVTAAGGTTLSTTTASTFSVENNTSLGDATTTDNTFFNSRIGSSLIPTVNNLLDIGDTTNGLAWRTGIFATSFGVGTTSPWGVLSVDAPSTANNITPIFVVADKGTTTPFIYVSGIQGDVGIRTNTPTYALDVTGGGRFTSIVDAASFSATSTTATSTMAGGLALETSGFVYDFSSNNVGIGTAAPSAQLHLNTVSGQNAFRVGSTTDQFIIDSVGRTGVGSTSPYALFAIESANQTDDLFRIATTSNRNVFVVDKVGNVGIGTNPTAGFDFYMKSIGAEEKVIAVTTTSGSANFAGYTAQAANSLFLISHGSAAAGTTFGVNNASNQFLYSNSSQLGIGTVDSAILTLGTSNTARITILQGGNVGVGTTSPGVLFAVDGDGAMITNTGSNHSLYVEDIADDTTPFVIAANGQVGVGTSTMTSNVEFSIHGDGQDANLLLGRSGGATFEIRGGQVSEGALFLLTGGTGNFDFYHGSTHNVRFANGGNVFIGDTTNANMTQGLTINQGTNDNEILALKSSEVDHGITNAAETDTYFSIFKNDGNAGGAHIYGFSEATRGLSLAAFGVTDNTTKSTSGEGYLRLFGYKKSGASGGTPGANANIASIHSGDLATWIVDAEGDTWQSGGATLEGADKAVLTLTDTSAEQDFIVRSQDGIFTVATSTDGITAGNYFQMGNNSGQFPINYNAAWNKTNGTASFVVSCNGCSGEGQFSLHYFDPADSANENRFAMNLGNNTVAYFWTDDSSNLRVATTFPTNATDGTVVGTQTSSLDSKNLSGEFTDYRGALNTILSTDLYNFTYKSGSMNNQEFTGIITDYSPTFGMDRDAAHPGGKTFNPVTAFGYTVGAFQALNDVIDLGNAPSTTPSIYIDENGRLGVGTTTPAYQLHVIGDVAAESFVNISTKEAKKNISYLGNLRKESLYEKLKTIGVATYYYEHEDVSTAPERLGLIAEEAPEEVLAKGGKGIDLYKLVTALLAAFQTLAEKVEKLEQAAATSVAAVTNSFSELFASKLTITNLLCLGDTCIGESELKSLLTNAGISASSTGETLTDEETTDTEAPAASDIEPPAITIIGANPAGIELNAVYSDNGATVLDNVDSNLGYSTYLNGVMVTEIGLDTSTTTTHYIDYVATDNAGNTATSTRTVIINDPNTPSGETATTTDETI